MDNIYKLKLTNLQQGILRLLFIKAGISLNQRQVSKILEVTPPAVMKALPALEKENLIKLECTECKHTNYHSSKNKKILKNRLEMKKFCRWCKKHTLHKETK